MAALMVSRDDLASAWCRFKLHPSLPKGLQHLALPPLFLPNGTVDEINDLTELTRLECMASNRYWPSQDLVSLKVRSSLKLVPEKQPVACRYDADEHAPP